MTSFRARKVATATRLCMSSAALAVAALGCSSDEASSGGAPPAIDGGNGADDGASPTRDASVAIDSDGVAPPVHGLRAEYFFEYMDLALERIEATLDQSWDTAPPSATVGRTRFSARWTGTLVPAVTGAHQIVTQSDDGIRVWIDGARVIDDFTGHLVTRDTATVELEAGVPVSIRVEYFQLDLGASARLLWSAVGAGLAEEVIPTKNLLAARTPSGMRGPKPPYTNPVVPFDCPDPGVIAVPAQGGTDYDLVCTGGTFPIRTSRGLVFWRGTGDAIIPSGKPPWAANGNRNWAPEIHAVGAGFVAYFTSVNAADVLSIGAAHATSARGPYTDIGHALVEDAAGVIDATFFEDDDGSRWLFYKIDGNSRGMPTPIFARRLAPDGLSFAAGSQPKQVLVNDPQSWEGGVVEAPWVVKRAGVYYLFYSGNVYDYRYRTGVARAQKVDDAYMKHGAPILANSARWVGPGHGSVAVANAKDYWVYHAWENAGNGTNGAGRFILVDRIDWVSGWPQIHGGTPSDTPQPWPGEDSL